MVGSTIRPFTPEAGLRYSPEHKERTREKILDRAARLFRERGFRGVSIDQIMAAARLTRGGFYRHFRSKGDLFAAVLRREQDFHRRLRARPGREPAELVEQALEVVGGYLHPDNRERVARGCPMATLSVDVARSGATVRRAYAEKLDDLAAELARGIPDGSERDPRALAGIALCVGGLTLARACGDEELAAAVQAACRDAVAQQLES